jgi:hypothetical protein
MDPNEHPIHKNRALLRRFNVDKKNNLLIVTNTPIEDNTKIVRNYRRYSVPILTTYPSLKPEPPKKRRNSVALLDPLDNKPPKVEKSNNLQVPRKKIKLGELKMADWYKVCDTSIDLCRLSLSKYKYPKERRTEFYAKKQKLLTKLT